MYVCMYVLQKTRKQKCSILYECKLNIYSTKKT